MTSVTGVDPAVQQMTIAEVIKPTMNLGSGILAEAVKEKREKALKSLTHFASEVLTQATQNLTALAEEKAALMKRISEIEKMEGKINRSAHHAQTTNNLFPLSAVIGMKIRAIELARTAGLQVPANDDPIWTVPDAQ